MPRCQEKACLEPLKQWRLQTRQASERLLSVNLWSDETAESVSRSLQHIRRTEMWSRAASANSSLNTQFWFINRTLSSSSGVNGTLTWELSHLWNAEKSRVSWMYSIRDVESYSIGQMVKLNQDLINISYSHFLNETLTIKWWQPKFRYLSNRKTPE